MEKKRYGDKTSYIKDVDLMFSIIKQKYPDRVEKCKKNITEHDINDRLDFFYNRSPLEITKVLTNEQQIREFVVKDLILDNIVLPEEEKMVEKIISRLEIDIKVKDSDVNAEKELLNRIFGVEKNEEY